MSLSRSYYWWMWGKFLLRIIHKLRYIIDNGCIFFYILIEFILINLSNKVHQSLRERSLMFIGLFLLNILTLGYILEDSQQIILNTLNRNDCTIQRMIIWRLNQWLNGWGF